MAEFIKDFKYLAFALGLHIFFLTGVLNLDPVPSPPPKTENLVEWLEPSPQKNQRLLLKSDQTKRVEKETLKKIPSKLSSPVEESQASLNPKPESVRRAPKHSIQKRGQTPLNQANRLEGLSPSLLQNHIPQPSSPKSKSSGGRVPLKLPGYESVSQKGGGLFNIQRVLPPGYKIETADITALNSEYSKFFIFNRRLTNSALPIWYNAVVKAVNNFFLQNPSNVVPRRWITHVEVTIDSSGEILDVQPYRLSGDWSFDRAPINAFKSLGKVPNPPREMLDENGYAHLKFGFSVYVSYTPVQMSNGNSPPSPRNRF